MVFLKYERFNKRTHHFHRVKRNHKLRVHQQPTMLYAENEISDRSAYSSIYMSSISSVSKASSIHWYVLSRYTSFSLPFAFEALLVPVFSFPFASAFGLVALVEGVVFFFRGARPAGAERPIIRSTLKKTILRSFFQIDSICSFHDLAFGRLMLFRRFGNQSDFLESNALFSVGDVNNSFVPIVSSFRRITVHKQEI